MIIDENNLKMIVAFSAIISAVIGAVINYVFNLSLKSREIKLKVVEKIIDKRLKAYEDIINVSKLFRLTGDTKQLDDKGILITYPSCMHTKDMFEEFRASFASVANQSSHWLNIDMFREINYVQDYLAVLDRTMDGKSNSSFPIVGRIVKRDFVDIAASLDKIANKFITNDLPKLKSIPTQGYHKYDVKITEVRLLSSELLKRIDEIDNINSSK